MQTITQYTTLFGPGNTFKSSHVWHAFHPFCFYFSFFCLLSTFQPWWHSNSQCWIDPIEFWEMCPKSLPRSLLSSLYTTTSLSIPPSLVHYNIPGSLEIVVVDGVSITPEVQRTFQSPETFRVCMLARSVPSIPSLFIYTCFPPSVSFLCFSFPSIQISISSWMLFVCSQSSSFPFPHPLFSRCVRRILHPYYCRFLIFASLLISLFISTPKPIYLITTRIAIRSLCCFLSLAVVWCWNCARYDSTRRVSLFSGSWCI